MSEYKPLTDGEARIIAEKEYNKFVSTTSAQDMPTIMMVAGQPGAGKSNAAEIVKAELDQKGGFIHVDADKARLKIPGGNTVPAATAQPDCQKIVTHLRALAMAGKRNIIEEGTFRGERTFSTVADWMHKSGYKAEAIGVSVHLEESRLSVHRRREELRAKGLPPRDVPEKYQEEAYRGFIKNMTEDTAALDRVRIVNREGQVLYNSLDPAQGKYTDAREMFTRDQSQNPSGKQLADIDRRWSELQREFKASPDSGRIREGRASLEVFRKERE